MTSATSPVGGSVAGASGARFGALAETTEAGWGIRAGSAPLGRILATIVGRSRHRSGQVWGHRCT